MRSEHSQIQQEYQRKFCIEICFSSCLILMFSLIMSHSVPCAEDWLFIGEGPFIVFWCDITRSWNRACKFLTPECCNSHGTLENWKSLEWILSNLRSTCSFFKSTYFHFQGWRLVSPHFSYLLDSAIFPALVMNEKVSVRDSYVYVCLISA